MSAAMRPAWPLDPQYQQRLREMGALIAAAGSWRFLHGPVVSASARDYPERWEDSRVGVARALARTVWHAHLDLELTLTDVRTAVPTHRARLRKSSIELVKADATAMELELAAIGNDNVAGILATEVGRAFTAQLAQRGNPTRTSGGGDPLPDGSAGTLAAVYLGLGVIATNASHYSRAAAEIVGRTVRHEHEIDQVGGLPSEHLAFLLAVQATVRDDVLRALDTLTPNHAHDVAAWCDVLDGHEDELLDLLEVADVDEAPVQRPAVPRTVRIVSERDEEALHRKNLGKSVRRYGERHVWSTAFLWCLGGVMLGLLPAMLFNEPAGLAIGPVVGYVAGFIYGRVRKALRCTGCGGFLRASDSECRACGGQIVGDVPSGAGATG